jgi:hypothetical protein
MPSTLLRGQPAIRAFSRVKRNIIKHFPRTGAFLEQSSLTLNPIKSDSHPTYSNNYFFAQVKSTRALIGLLSRRAEGYVGHGKMSSYLVGSGLWDQSWWG